MVSAQLLTEPPILSILAWLLLASVSWLCPADSYIHIFLHLCGTAPGHLFSAAFLAWTGYVCRLTWRLVRFCAGHCADGRREGKTRYSSLPSAKADAAGDEGPPSPEGEEKRARANGGPSAAWRGVALDLAAVISLYLGLCGYAYAFWSPPTFDLETILASKEASSEGLRTFPPDFVFGASTSAYQVEGGNYNNDWSRFENETGLARCGAAADVWNRFERDVAELLLAENGTRLDVLRISVEWSRVEPERGAFDDAALDKYASWAALLRENGIRPIVTLHHFTNPLWFAALGGFENDAAPSLIAPFVRKVVERLGPHVDAWITINEMMVYAGNGYLMGEFPPGRKGEAGTMLRVVQNMLRCHASMYRTIKEIDGGASVSIAKNAILYQPTSYLDLPSVVAAAISDVYYNAMPMRVLERQGTIDFVGINTYIRMKVGRLGSVMGFVNPPEARSDMGWDLEPQVLYQVARQYHAYLPELDIIVTEHGAADGAAPDVRRVEFLRESLIGMAVAIHEEGLPVRGYCHWSLVDNFEWSAGFEPRFGLYRIDLPNDQERRMTKGGELYREIIETRTVPLR